MFGGTIAKPKPLGVKQVTQTVHFAGEKPPPRSTSLPGDARDGTRVHRRTLRPGYCSAGCTPALPTSSSPGSSHHTPIPDLTQHRRAGQHGRQVTPGRQLKIYATRWPLPAITLFETDSFTFTAWAEGLPRYSRGLAPCGRRSEDRWCNTVSSYGFSSKSPFMLNEEQVMTNLLRASHELFRRTPDETFPSLDVFHQHFQWQKGAVPRSLATAPDTQCPAGAWRTTDARCRRRWGLHHQRLELRATLPALGNRQGDGEPADAGHRRPRVRRDPCRGAKSPCNCSRRVANSARFTPPATQRLHNAELLDVVNEVATDFQPPPAGFNGATGLYGGEQDMFCFLIDPAGWTEIDGEACRSRVLPVGTRRSAAAASASETFWYQAICANHIVWDATEIVEFSPQTHGQRLRSPQRNPRGHRSHWSASGISAATAS